MIKHLERLPLEGMGLCAGEADAIIFHSRREDRELSTPAWLQNEANTMNGPAVESFIFGRV